MTSSAREISPQEASRWMEDSQVLNKADELYLLILNDDISNLEFALQRLALPQQEVTRYLILQHMEEQELILSEQVARFVQAQLGVNATYQVREQGDGYEVVTPAFNSSAIASRLLKRRQQDQGVLEFILAAEQNKLQLIDWLSGPEHQTRQREKLLIAELDGLSPRALDRLVQQLISDSVMHWLPSTSVVVRVAQVSQNPAVYDLLWRMRVDHHSRQEVRRLGQLADEFSIQQLLSATHTPSLRADVIQQLTQLDPLPLVVKTYLVEQMQHQEQTQSLARQLVDHGHRPWLEQIVKGNHGVNSNILLQVLSLSKDN